MKLSDLAARLNKHGLFKLAAQLGGTAVGSPIAGAGLGQIAGALGAKDASPEALAMAIDAADPEDLAALRRIDAEMAAREMDNIERLAEIEARDRVEARTRHGDEWTRRILAGFMIFAALAFGAFGVVLYSRGSLSAEAAGLIGTVMGWLIRDASGANAFYFGTSAGSRNKESFIAREMGR